MAPDYYKTTYDCISQRAVASFGKVLAACKPAASERGDSEVEVASRQDLHAFFTALYAAMYQNPDRFGLPVSADDGLAGAEKPNRKQEVAKKLKKPREIIDTTVSLLRDLGLHGRLAAGALIVAKADYQGLCKSNAKAKKTILAGLADIGLEIREGEQDVTVRNARYPHMMPAWQAMAEQCAAGSDPKISFFHFARCDFRVLTPGYSPDAPDLLAYFSPPEREDLLRLHEYLLSTGHRATCRIYGIHAWDIQYQGARKIKGTPLFQIDYDERHINPLQLHLKCASTDRLLPFFAQQNPGVQADFIRRTYKCRAEACGWCKNRNNLGPSAVEYEGKTLAICWYTKPEVGNLSDETIELIRDYVSWHALLASA